MKGNCVLVFRTAHGDYLWSGFAETVHTREIAVDDGRDGQPVGTFNAEAAVVTIRFRGPIAKAKMGRKPKPEELDQALELGGAVVLELPAT